jgi:hypothetical protein
VTITEDQMNRLTIQLFAGTALALSAPAYAEAGDISAPATATIATAPAASPAIAVAPATIGAQPVSLRTLSTLSSKTAKVGDEISLEVTQDVVVDGKLVIASGSRAFGEVTKVRHRRGWGKPGTIEARVTSVLVGGQRVALSGTIATTGQSRKKQAIRYSLIIAPFWGFWIHGTEAELPATATAMLAGDTALALASAAPAATGTPAVIASAAPAPTEGTPAIQIAAAFVSPLVEAQPIAIASSDILR